MKHTDTTIAGTSDHTNALPTEKRKNGHTWHNEKINIRPIQCLY
jgi:hypothetical protein